MMASSASDQTVCASAWVLDARFDAEEHPHLANPATNYISPDYVKEVFRGRASYLAKNMKRNESHFVLNVDQPVLLNLSGCCGFWLCHKGWLALRLRGCNGFWLDYTGFGDAADSG
jgi:hypothetical protein